MKPAELDWPGLADAVAKVLAAAYVDQPARFVAEARARRCGVESLVAAAVCEMLREKIEATLRPEDGR